MKAKVDQLDVAVNSPKAKRGPGRPQSSQGGAINRNVILRAALKLSVSMPLQDLSIVTVAKAMKVTPALIHYYIGGRDWMTSGIMNLFYKDLIRRWPEPTGDWKVDLLAAARVVFDQFVRYGGVAAYVVSNSRFRVFQLTAFGDRDFGVETLDRFTGCVRSAGLSGERTGIYANQFMEFIISTGHAASHHIFPSEHKQFLEEKTSKLDASKYPHIVFAGHAPITINGTVAFEEGCNLYLLAIMTEASGTPLAEAVNVSPAAGTAAPAGKTPKKSTPR